MVSNQQCSVWAIGCHLYVEILNILNLSFKALDQDSWQMINCQWVHIIFCPRVAKISDRSFLMPNLGQSIGLSPSMGINQNKINYLWYTLSTIFNNWPFIFLPGKSQACAFFLQDSICFSSDGMKKSVVGNGNFEDQNPNILISRPREPNIARHHHWYQIVSLEYI